MGSKHVLKHASGDSETYAVFHIQWNGSKRVISSRYGKDVGVFRIPEVRVVQSCKAMSRELLCDFGYQGL
jgi:hypothetical protein